MSLLEQVCEAAGFHPTSPGVIDRSLRQVEGWMNLGVDFEAVVLPTIRNVIAHDPEPTRTLGRFTKHIAHEHARRKANTANGTRYVPPESPMLERKDEEPAMSDLRQVLCQVLGPAQFCVTLNRIRLVEIEDGTLRLEGIHATRVMDSIGPTIRAVAKRHGFERVWT